MKLKDFFNSEPVVLPEFKPLFIRPAGTRICEADGRPAFFHCWVEEDKALLQLDSFLHPVDAENIKMEFDRHGYVPALAHIEKVRQTFALVEYADGTVGKIEPEKIKFTDREGKQ